MHITKGIPLFSKLVRAFALHVNTGEYVLSDTRKPPSKQNLVIGAVELFHLDIRVLKYSIQGLVGTEIIKQRSGHRFAAEGHILESVPYDF